jgi:putative acetyltransferase
VASDAPDLETLYGAAFPDEDLLPLVKRLLREEPAILSLAAEVADRLAGHIIFTPCGVDHRNDCVALLGPLAVMPSRQRQGVGRALVRVGLDQLAQGNARRVLVLGDPAYYGRFGFLPEDSILPPYDLPATWTAAWQSIAVGADVVRIAGQLRPPAAWLQAALWAP